MKRSQIGLIEVILIIMFFIAFSIGGVWLSYNCQTKDPIVKRWCEQIGNYSWFILITIIGVLIIIPIVFFWARKEYSSYGAVV